MKKDNKVIVLVGGGSGGPVAPLLAVADSLKEKHGKNVRLFFIGTKHGVEREMVKRADIPFIPVISGKLRRYWTLRNIATPFLLIIAWFQAWRILRELRAECVVGTGSFVQVPVMWAAWLLKIPVVTHQQDVVPSLSNTLVAPIASKITVTFEKSLEDFEHAWSVKGLAHSSKVMWTGNPFRDALKSGTREKAIKAFHLDPNYPTLLVLGGGTGAAPLNEIIWESLPELTKIVNVLHAAGPGKARAKAHERYHIEPFINDMAAAYAAADLVVARAGLSTLTELAHLQKPALLIPMPNSHQEKNAAYFADRGCALMVAQDKIIPERFPHIIRGFLFDQENQAKIKENLKKVMPEHADRKIADIVYEIVVSAK